MQITRTNNPTARLASARQTSPDWQEAQGLATALRIGQLCLDTKEIDARLSTMQPHHREELVGLLRRWAELDADASALVGDIDATLRERIA